jgi:hypothetical protein
MARQPSVGTNEIVDLGHTLSEEITRPVSSRQGRHEAVKAASKAKLSDAVPPGVLTESQAKARHKKRVAKKGNPPRRKPYMSRVEQVTRAIDAKISTPHAPKIWKDDSSDRSDREPSPVFDLAKGFPPIGNSTMTLQLREDATNRQSQPI